MPYPRRQRSSWARIKLSVKSYTKNWFFDFWKIKVILRPQKAVSGSSIFQPTFEKMLGKIGTKEKMLRFYWLKLCDSEIFKVQSFGYPAIIEFLSRRPCLPAGRGAHAYSRRVKTRKNAIMAGWLLNKPAIAHWMNNRGSTFKLSNGYFVSSIVSIILIFKIVSTALYCGQYVLYATII